MNERPVGAVTFDYWNTILRPNPSVFDIRVEAWRARYQEAGHDVDEEALRVAFAAVWEEHQASWLRNEQYTAERAARTALELIDRPIDEITREALVESFTTQTAGVELCDGVAELIVELHAHELRLGIICDVGFTSSTVLRGILERFGLLSLFTGWSFSDEVGWYKPAPEIFRHALSYLAVLPQHVAHIGDLRRTDVAGAKAAGMVALRYRGVYDDASDGPEGDYVIDHHAEVPAVLGL